MWRFRDFSARSLLGLISSHHVGDEVRAVENDERGEVVPSHLVKDIKDPVDHPADFVPELTFLERHEYLALLIDHFKMAAVFLVLRVAKLDRALFVFMLEFMNNLFVAWGSCGCRRLSLEDIF